jgi:hypothetical protein
VNHQPKQLALLISLIGIGVSPYAQARFQEQRVDLQRLLPGIGCNEADAAALPSCDSAPELVWQPQRSALDLSGTPGVLVLYSASRDDGAPNGTPADERAFAAPGESEEEADTRGQASTATVVVNVEATNPVQPPHAAASKHTRKMRRVRALANVEATVKFDRQAVERIEPLQLVEVRAAQRVADASPETEWLLDNLVAVLSELPVLPTNPPAATLETAAEAPAGRVEKSARMRDANPAQIDRPEVAVESQSVKVLRMLGAILSDERDEVGAIRADTMPSVASTPSAKVLSMLSEIRPVAPAVEDGPTRRLRKLAARAEKAEAKVAADAVAAGVVDVMLPLEAPTAAARPIEAVGTAAAIRIEPVPIAVGTPPEPKARTNPFGDRRVAVAETALDRVRGGFLGEGLNISFGIERAVYINGSLVVSTVMNLTQLGQVAAGRGATTLDAGTIALVQNGMGNSVATGSISPSTIGTVIQNTLDGQKIQNVTIVNATANSLGVFRNLNLGSSLRGAVIDSLRR